MKWSVITLFPELFTSFTQESVIGRAFKTQKAQLDLVNLRNFGEGKHRQVDDTVYGGGDGMLIQCPPVFDAFEDLSKRYYKKDLYYNLENIEEEKQFRSNNKILHVYMSPQGKELTQKKVEQLSTYQHIVVLCGRYEGVDNRVRETLIDEEISVGPYVLSGGELPAMILMDSVIRLLPGVLGKEGSHEQDSFSLAFNRKKEYPHYTKPANFRGMKVPDVLLSGHHSNIELWRKKMLKSAEL